MKHTQARSGNSHSITNNGLVKSIRIVSLRPVCEEIPNDWVLGDENTNVRCHAGRKVTLKK